MSWKNIAIACLWKEITCSVCHVTRKCWKACLKNDPLSPVRLFSLKITLVLYSGLYGNMLRGSFNAYRLTRSVSSLAAVSIGPVIGPAVQAVCNIRPLYCLPSNKVRQLGTRKRTRSIFINVSSGVFTLIAVICFLFKAFKPRISVGYVLLGRRIVVILVVVAADKFLLSTASTLWGLCSRLAAKLAGWWC
jgi:hypothetical protein